MLHLIRWFLLFLMIFLAGCASNMKLDSTVKSRLDAGIAINPVVVIADQPYFFGRTQALGVAFGAIGGGLAAVATMSEPKKIKQYLEAEEIDVSSIVLEEFKRQIKNRPDFADRIRDDGKFQMQLEILMYGISVETGFSSTYKPILNLRAKLVDPAGKTIWQQSNYIGPLNSKSQGYSYDSYFDNPENFKSAFKSAAEIVVTRVLEKLE